MQIVVVSKFQSNFETPEDNLYILSQLIDFLILLWSNVRFQVKTWIIRGSLSSLCCQYFSDLKH